MAANTGKWDNPYKKYCKDFRATRETYLRQLAEDYDYPYHKLIIVADILSHDGSEDFTGLIEHLNDLPVWG